MYNQYFGLKERPFKLVPNPAYLYLSRSHEEALGHLNYAIQHGDGFVEITGEAGTGKTTICRMFLENLDDHSDAAYIFNPKLDSIQLLKAINTEFGIDAVADNIRDLIDVLNRYLLERKADRKHAILLIDEAQNLSKDVLEQLRLLSNLEMNAAKLIQIILVGQPELSEMLDSYELRQLSQRITLRCHLMPLSLKETGGYIRHRLGIASCGSRVKFTRPAIRAIYRHSCGIPRLINIVCDRSLLAAFSENKRVINRNVVRTAIAELKGRGRQSTSEGIKPILLFAGLCLVLLLLIRFPSGISGNVSLWEKGRKGGRPASAINSINREPRLPRYADDRSGSGPAQPSVSFERSTARDSFITNENNPMESLPPETTSSAPQQVPTDGIASHGVRMESGKEKDLPPEPPLQELQSLLQGFSARTSRKLAATGAIRRWHADADVMPYLDAVDDDLEFFRLAAKQNGLMTIRTETDLNTLCRINLPAILELYPEGGLTPRYLAVTRVDEKRLTVMLDDTPVMVAAVELTPYWKGGAIVPWKNFYNYVGLVPINAPRDTILTLKMHLKEIGNPDVPLNPFYDDATREVITRIQGKHGIVEDGIVGPLTYIVLYNATASLSIPHLSNEEGNPKGMGGGLALVP